jgi:hypothetical protein
MHPVVNMLHHTCIAVEAPVVLEVLRAAKAVPLVPIGITTVISRSYLALQSVLTAQMLDHERCGEPVAAQAIICIAQIHFFPAALDAVPLRHPFQVEGNTQFGRSRSSAQRNNHLFNLARNFKCKKGEGPHVILLTF